MESPEGGLTNGWDPVEAFSGLRIWTYFWRSETPQNNKQTDDPNMTQILPKCDTKMTQPWPKYDPNITQM